MITLTGNNVAVQRRIQEVVARQETIPVPVVPEVSNHPKQLVRDQIIRTLAGFIGPILGETRPVAVRWLCEQSPETRDALYRLWQARNLHRARRVRARKR